MNDLPDNKNKRPKTNELPDNKNKRPKTNELPDNKNKRPKLLYKDFKIGHDDQYIYNYPFALKPEDNQPSGTCNLSRIMNSTCQLTYVN